MNEERSALRTSVFGSLFFALLGIGFATSVGSQAILLDGFFSLINFVMGIITLRVATLVVKPADDRFHFGYGSFEPLLNVIKGLVLLAVCGFAGASAANSLMNGGRSMEMGWGFLYALIATIGGFAVAGVQKRAAGRTASPLVEVEIRGWRIDGLMSAGVALAFGVSYFAQGSRFESLLPFVDPSLVILLVLIALPIPLRTVLKNFGELMLGAPPGEVQGEVRDRVQRVVRTLPVERTEIRMMKVGRQRAALVYVLVSPGTALKGIEELDDVRQRITDELASLEPSWVVDVLFVADEVWIF